MAEIEKGFVLLSRQIIESEIMKKPPLYLKVWIWLLTQAQHSAYKNLKRGQLWTSIPEIQDVMTYKIGYRTEKPTKKEIWNILEWLRNPHEGYCEENDNGTMIETTKGTQGILVNIRNYDHYQNPKNYEGNDEGDNENPTKEPRRERQGNNTNKNEKNEKNEKNINKKVSKKSFDDLIKTYTSNEKLINALNDYITMRINKKSKPTNRALELVFGDLDNFSNNDDDIKIKILEESIKRNWTGVFALKNDKGGDNSGKSTSNSGTYKGIDTSKFCGKAGEIDDSGLM